MQLFLFCPVEYEKEGVICPSASEIAEFKNNYSRYELKNEQNRSRLLQLDQELSEAIKHVEMDASIVQNERAASPAVLITFGSASNS